MKQWYYASNGQQVGPLDEADLQRRFTAGELPGETLVWASHLAQWMPASSVPEFASLWAGPAVSQRTPTAFGPIPPPMTVEAGPYAGFWKRLAAGLIDAVILNAAVFLLLMLLRPDARTLQLLGLLVGWMYHALFESSPWQGSLGKVALGIQVTDGTGGRIGFLRATGRHFGKLLSGFLLMMGFFMIAFTEKKQGLHDILSGCLVVNR